MIKSWVTLPPWHTYKGGDNPTHPPYVPYVLMSKGLVFMSEHERVKR